MQLDHRLHEFAGKNMSFFVWLRLVTHEKLLGFHRQHIDAQKRDARREYKFNQHPTGTSSVLLAAHLLGKHTSVVGRRNQGRTKSSIGGRA